MRLGIPVIVNYNIYFIVITKKLCIWAGEQDIFSDRLNDDIVVLHDGGAIPSFFNFIYVLSTILSFEYLNYRVNKTADVGWKEDITIG